MAGRVHDDEMGRVSADREADRSPAFRPPGSQVLYTSPSASEIQPHSPTSNTSVRLATSPGTRGRPASFSGLRSRSEGVGAAFFGADAVPRPGGNDDPAVVLGVAAHHSLTALITSSLNRRGRVSGAAATRSLVNTRLVMSDPVGPPGSRTDAPSCRNRRHPQPFVMSSTATGEIQASTLFMPAGDLTTRKRARPG